MFIYKDCDQESDIITLQFYADKELDGTVDQTKPIAQRRLPTEIFACQRQCVTGVGLS